MTVKARERERERGAKSRETDSKRQIQVCLGVRHMQTPPPPQKKKKKKKKFYPAVDVRLGEHDLAGGEAKI